MRYLLDTHLLIWTSLTPKRLPQAARAIMEVAANELLFSAASIWETAIKHGMARSDFEMDPGILRHGLLDAGYRELPITGPHGIAVALLQPLHKDPFDRLLVAQAVVEDIVLLTSDKQVARYPGPIKLV